MSQGYDFVFTEQQWDLYNRRDGCEFMTCLVCGKDGILNIDTYDNIIGWIHTKTKQVCSGWYKIKDE